MQLLIQKAFLTVFTFFSLSWVVMDQDVFGRYHFIRKYYDVAERKINISEEIFLQLNSDSSYYYLLHDLNQKAADTGIFSIKGDTVYFSSKYTDSIMHRRYDFYVRNEVFFEERLDDRLYDIDTSKWFYFRMEVLLPPKSLEKGFHLTLGDFSHSYSGDIAAKGYEMCLPKRHFRNLTITRENDLEIYFPDLNLVVKGSSSSMGKTFKHALICRLHTNFENPGGYFMTPKTLQNHKMAKKGDSLMFIKDNGKADDDIILKRNGSQR